MIMDFANHFLLDVLALLIFTSMRNVILSATQMNANMITINVNSRAANVLTRF